MSLGRALFISRIFILFSDLIDVSTSTIMQESYILQYS